MCDGSTAGFEQEPLPLQEPLQEPLPLASHRRRLQRSAVEARATMAIAADHF